MPDQNKFDKVFVRGDVTSNEIVLSKILFAENYGVESEIVLDTGNIDFHESNYLIAGQENNEFVVKQNAVSFSDQIAEFINYPYVNFVLSSVKQELITEINALSENIDEKIEVNIFKILDKMNFDETLNKYISENIDTVYYEMTENEVDGLLELLKLPYYHGVTEDLFELKLVP